MEDESELDSSSESPKNSNENDKQLTIAELIDEMCVYYLSIGVSWNDFWYGDYTQLGYIRKAHELKTKRENYQAWLQGAYIYDALCAVSPLLQAFASKGTKAHPYLKYPYGEEPKMTKEEFLKKWRADKEKWKAIQKQKQQ